jgi:hypothetical protein
MQRLVLSLIIVITTLFLVVPTQQANPILGASLSAQQSCSGISANPSSVSAINAGGSGTIFVNAPSGCNWSPTSLSGFISISGYNQSIGTVNFFVSSNPGPPRSGTIRIGSSGNYTYVSVFQAGVATVALYRYWNPSVYNHFYTTDFGVYGNGGGGYTYEGVECRVYASQVSGTVPLKHYYCADNGDHFYTTLSSEPGSGLPCYQYQGIECYVFSSQVSGTVPLYRYYEPNAQDHFYTTNFNELGNGGLGWYLEGVQCYVFP